MTSSSLSGLILVDKAAGLTSHSVVSAIRKILKMDKVGHLGTLDPFATGLLPILVGGSTRLSDEIMDGKKQYLFTISLGVETDTLDYSGRTIAEAEVPVNFDVKIKDILSQFIGEVEQIPPVYSALKMNGRPLYEYMRATGKLPDSIETKKRLVFIEKLELVSSDLEKKSVVLRVLCGKGTYVRSLARDISIEIGTVGHCSQLRREYVEPWSVDNAIFFSFEEKPSQEILLNNLILPEQMLPTVPKIELVEEFFKQLSSGNVIVLGENQVAEKTSSESIKTLVNCTRIFVKIEGYDFMFLADVEYIKSEEIFKIKPKKKIS
ncbi:tRNA pseudouridine(55) synthase TruB [Fluviispira multicolorata]|uniref:tRNA pseudouridine(55) synthase TruB n=1 Tax=Fluviispira multicolorata TaxID=2654512 RepID=UPI001375EE82|nr:tRNA pseudouridine(55) synthase TruB [Fluviispira multicolorata]